MQVLGPCGTLVVSSAFLITKIMLLYTLFIGAFGEGKVTHSSILAGEIPWTEKPGGLQSMGSQSQT